ncbi:hypothetical protein [Streptomyces sp. NBC_00233]|uniref:hypothetical protein n=1 Tax=Streptomyces sp. NBC_00233 TaxID=2975686 RepID=UPI002257A394|nr:hypothetical protein [Streptomyces sp. NBC_00233]MCX5233100.1 hypothetical protein [Streptomyces sp. NBC_00233]
MLDATGARDVGDVLEELDGVVCEVGKQAPERPHTSDVPACPPTTFRAYGPPPFTRPAQRPDHSPRKGYLERVTALVALK